MSLPQVLPPPQPGERDGRARRASAWPLNLVFGLLALILLAAALAYAALQWERAKEDEWSQLSHLSELVARSTEQHLDTHFSNLRVIAGIIAEPAARGDYAEIKRLIGEFQANYSMLAGVGLIALDGQVLATTVRHAPGSALPNINVTTGARDSFDELLAKESAPPRLRAIKPAPLKEWVIPLRHVVRHATGEPRHVITALLSVGRLGALWQPAAAQREAAYMLMRPDGHRLLRVPQPEDPDAYYGQQASGTVFTLLTSKPPLPAGKYLTQSRDGTPAISAFTRLARYDLAAVVAMPQSRLWVSWRQRVAVPMAIFAALFAAAAAASVIAGRIQRRQHELRLATEARLREADGRLSVAVESGDLATWEFDPIARTTYFDRGWEKHLGLAVDATYRTWEQVIPLLNPADVAGWKAKTIRLLKGEIGLFHEEVRMRVQSGQWRWFSVRGRVVARNAQGRALRCAGVAIDNTERRLARDVIEKARATAEAESRTKSNFLGRMSQTVRTPLEGVVGMTALLEHTGLTPDQSALVSAIRSSGEHLLHGINDLLDFSRMEAGKLTLEKAAFELRPVVAATLQPWLAQAQEKGLELKCEIAQDVPDWIVADRMRLCQVLDNIVSNAVKFTGQGRIEVRVAVAERSERMARLRFVVSDTGVGITREVQRTLFDGFVQFDAGGARQYGSSGLGLALCKGLLQLMEGDIRVASEPGAGSTFEFSAQVGAEQRTSAAQPWRPQRLLQMPRSHDSARNDESLAIPARRLNTDIAGPALKK